MSSGSDTTRPSYPSPHGQFPPAGYPPGYGPWMGPPPPPPPAGMPGSWMQPWPPAVGGGQQFLGGPQYPGAQQWFVGGASAPGPVVEDQRGGQRGEHPRGDEYMVDSLRRIYSNDDSSIEIERVKVQRRQGGGGGGGVGGAVVGVTSAGPPALTFPGCFPQQYRPAVDTSRSIVPVAGPQVPPERRPPPRKHRKNRLNNELVPAQMPVGSYPPYYPPPPYMSYVPYPYPYPYPYFNYPWPQTSQEMPTNFQTWEAKDKKNESKHQNHQQRSLPASPDSQRLDSGTTRSIRDSITPEMGRPLSPNAPSQVSQITESQGTDIGPSDSVSVGGYCKGKNNILKTDTRRSSDWMVEMQKNLANIDDSSEAGDRSSFTTAPSDIPSPPCRRSKLLDNSTMKKASDNIDDDDIGSTITDKTGSDLNLAFKNFANSVDIFKNQVSSDAKQRDQPGTSEGQPRVTTHQGASSLPQGLDQHEGDRRSSTASFHSTRNTSDVLMAETDSTDIFIPTDTATGTADEEPPDAASRKPPLPPMASRSGGCISPQLEEEGDVEGSFKWVMQGKGEAPDLTQQQGANTWLADVSLWRARLVVSLDRGQGLDQQDWATFHLLLQHPLPLHLKLSMLHAPRICAANANTGAGQVRAALLQLARHAQLLLQKEDERPSGWKTITAHKGQPWMPVKGGLEILRILGYRSRDDGTLKYSRRYALEASHLARLTLDLLVFADELRLYLTGGHPHPTNISDLFCPITFSAPVSPEPLGLQMNPEKPASFTSSADFISAESTPVQERKQINFDDSESVQQSVKVDYNKQLLDHRSSSEEDVTLHEDDDMKEKCKTLPLTVKEKSEAHISTTLDNQRMSVGSSFDHSTGASERRSLSTDITSLPDLQSISSLSPSRLSNVTKSGKQSDYSSVNTPVTSPVPPPDNSGNQKPANGKKEDHIYEEIGEIRAQVKKLRGSVSVPNLPPPLPPKTRSSCQDDENSILYSRSDWSTSSSMGGSTGRRRKKRRAPLPPSFLYEDQIMENQSLQEMPSETVDLNVTISSTVSAPVHSNDGKKTINPFYEEIGERKPKLPSVEESVANESKKPINPFYDTKPKPSGYVGANPFYEDISVLRAKISQQTSQTESISSDNTVTLLNSSYEVQFDQSDGNTPPVAAARPKRRAPRPPKIAKDMIQVPATNEPDRPNADFVEQSTSKVQPEEQKPINTSQETIRVRIPDSNCSNNSKDETVEDLTENPQSRGTLPRMPSESELHDVDLNSTNEESLSRVPVEATSINRNYPPPKNVNQKQHQGSQDVVSVDGVVSESTEKMELKGAGIKPTLPAYNEPAYANNKDSASPESKPLPSMTEVNKNSTTKENVDRNSEKDNSNRYPSSTPEDSIENSLSIPYEKTNVAEEIEQAIEGDKMMNQRQRSIQSAASVATNSDESPSGSDPTTVICVKQTTGTEGTLTNSSPADEKNLSTNTLIFEEQKMEGITDSETPPGASQETASKEHIKIDFKTGDRSTSQINDVDMQEFIITSDSPVLQSKNAASEARILVGNDDNVEVQLPNETKKTEPVKVETGMAAFDTGLPKSDATIQSLEPNILNNEPIAPVPPSIADELKTAPAVHPTAPLSKIEYSASSACEKQEPLPIRPQKAVLNLIDDIPYIDTNDVKNYKYAMVQARKPSGTLKRTAISPIEFLQNSIPFIDENNASRDLHLPSLPPPPPPPGSPPSSPINTPPETPHTSPPPTPPLTAFEDANLSEDSSSELLKHRLSKISENTELDYQKSEEKSENKDELTSPVIFGNPDLPPKKVDRRISSAYYEIPEVAETPPPLPAKPSNLRNVSLLQRTPEIPPKSAKLATQRGRAPARVIDDERYEIPDVTIANALAAQTKASNINNSDDISITTSSNRESATDDSSNPNKPPRRRRHSSLGSPPRPPKTFSSHFMGLNPHPSASSLPAGRAATLPGAARATSPRRPSVSTPSSPRPTPQPKLRRQSVPDKSRKSWPFLFCDCLYANYEASPYDRNKPRS